MARRSVSIPASRDWRGTTPFKRVPKVGKRVHHAIFGAGTVRELPAHQRHTHVGVEFDAHGLKVLIWTFAQGKLRGLARVKKPRPATGTLCAGVPVVFKHEDIVARFPKEHARLPRGTLVRQVGKPAGGRKPRLLGMVLNAEHLSLRGANKEPWVRVQWMGADGSTVQNPKFLAAVTDDQVRTFLREIESLPDVTIEPGAGVTVVRDGLKAADGTPLGLERGVYPPKPKSCRCRFCRDVQDRVGNPTLRSNLCTGGRRIKGLGISNRGVGKKD